MAIWSSFWIQNLLVSFVLVNKVYDKINEF